MNPISAIELAKIRSDASVIFDKKCTIRRNSQTFDSKGGSADDLIVIDDNVPCAMVGLSMPTQQFLADQPIGIDSRTLHTPYGTNLQVNDIITIDSIDYSVLSLYGEKTIQVFTSGVILRKTPL